MISFDGNHELIICNKIMKISSVKKNKLKLIFCHFVINS